MDKVIQTSFGLLLFLALLPLLNLSVKAQSGQQPPHPSSITADKSAPGADDQAPSALEYELSAKRAIKYAEKEHQENLSRAREACELGGGLAAAFKRNHSLSSDDLRKLDKLEKITRKIRSELGVSDEEITLEDKPADLAGAVASMAKVSSSLNDRVMKTPRRVVSAALIEEVNVLLELIRVVRNFAR